MTGKFEGARELSIVFTLCRTHSSVIGNIQGLAKEFSTFRRSPMYGRVGCMGGSQRSKTGVISSGAYLSIAAEVNDAGERTAFDRIEKTSTCYRPIQVDDWSTTRMSLRDSRGKGSSRLLPENDEDEIEDITPGPPSDCLHIGFHSLTHEAHNRPI